MLLLREREIQTESSEAAQSNALPRTWLGFTGSLVISFQVGGCMCVHCMHVSVAFFHVYFNKKARRSVNRLHRVDPH